MQTICAEHDLLKLHDGMLRVPFLVGGRIVAPRSVTRSEIDAVFAGAGPEITHRYLPGAQVLREPQIDRSTLQHPGDYVYQVLPAVEPAALLPAQPDALIAGPYAVSTAELLDFFDAVAATLAGAGTLLEETLSLFRTTSELPDLFLEHVFASLPLAFSRSDLQTGLDAELSAWGIPGSRFLDGWVEVPAAVVPGLTPLMAGQIAGGRRAWLGTATRPRLRAMPTRQLHITAGNTPTVPFVSTLRLLLTKSVGVVKSSYGATLPAALLALALAAAAPGHPLVRHLSIAYWPGGDPEVETPLFLPNVFDRIVAWGGAAALESIQARALATRVVSFNPRYSASFIGREAFADDVDLDDVAARLAQDVLIYNQRACNASHVQYVEGTPDQVAALAAALRRALAAWDEIAPQPVAPALRGHIKRMRRGRYAAAQWEVNAQGDAFASGVLLLEDEFNVLEHPMCRLAVLRRVDDLEAALAYLHAGVSTVGVYPEARRLALLERIAGRGVSVVLPLGQCEQVFAGAPHDGMLVLQQLIEWKVA